MSNTANLVKSILHQKNLAHVAFVAHGVENDKLALLQLQRQENVEILPCSLFIDSVHPFIGASPGLMWISLVSGQVRMGHYSQSEYIKMVNSGIHIWSLG